MLRLTRKSISNVPLEAPCITPDRLASLSVHEIERLPVQHGNRVEAIGDHFKVGGNAEDMAIVIDGDCSQVKWLGANMTAGTLRIESSVSMHAGSAMRAGRLEIVGDADDWLGAEMHGGLIRVHGSASDHVGGAYDGNAKGMTGGVLLVDGTTGVGTGAVMRRGLIATRGCGEFAGASMITGSIFVVGPLGRYAGAQMKRGTIAVFGSEPELLPTFRPSCVCALPFLTVYLRRLAAIGFEPARGIVAKQVRRYCGDLVSLGMGEILHAVV